MQRSHTGRADAGGRARSHAHACRTDRQTRLGTRARSGQGGGRLLRDLPASMRVLGLLQELRLSHNRFSKARPGERGGPRGRDRASAGSRKREGTEGRGRGVGGTVRIGGMRPRASPPDASQPLIILFTADRLTRSLSAAVNKAAS